MPKAVLYDMTGKKKGEIDLPEQIFGITPNKEAMRQAVRRHMQNRRQGTQSTLTRAEVSGGGAKPWRQKGTGRARQGSTRSPQWTHGGIAFGPKPREFHFALNKKVRRLALLSALSDKAAQGKVVVVEGLDLPEIKTKTMKSFLDAASISGRTLLVTPEVRQTVYKSARNIPGVGTTPAAQLSVYEIICARNFVIDRDAIGRIEEVYAQ